MAWVAIMNRQEKKGKRGFLGEARQEKAKHTHLLWIFSWEPWEGRL
jgi:hypothetical protein